MKRFKPRQALGSFDIEDDTPAVSECSLRVRAELVKIFEDIANSRPAEPGRKLTHAELVSGKY